MEWWNTIKDSILTLAVDTSALLWGLPMIILLVGTHIYMTVRTGFVQRRLGTAIKLSVTNDDGSKGEVSQFGALAISLAATVGTGNIVGVGTAIASGGPGAVFWCWIVGVFGIATKYSETLLAVKYRTKTEDGRVIGGAMVVIDKVMHKRWLAIAFCVFTLFASFGIGNMNQANSISTLAEHNFGIPTYITGIFLSIIVGIVILGGVKWISKVCQVLVPFMAVFFLVGCIWLLCLNSEFIIPAIKTILREAFSVKSVSGGLMGGGIMVAMRYGIARGLFSNESGLGSAPLVAAQAKTKNAVRQALVSSTGTFWDTVVLCGITGVVMVSSILAYPDIDYTSGAAISSLAFGKIHQSGAVILTVALFTFVFSTLLGWSCYGERVLEYWLGVKSVVYYRVAWTLFVFIGAVVKISFVWTFSDIANALMAIPNVIMVLALSGVVAKETRKYLWSNNLDAVDHDMEC